MYDVIIIGKGPAGISASLYTIRANLKTLVIGKNDSALRKTDKIENYYGFDVPISGEFLLHQGDKQALRLGVEILEDEVISIEKKELFEVMTGSEKYVSKAILISTGQPQKKLNIGRLSEFEGKGVSYCSTCDGFFYRNLKVGVLGFKDYAIHEALELQAFTENITVFTNGMKLELTEKFSQHADRFKINKQHIQTLGGTEFLEKVHFSDGSEETIDGIFVAYESASSIDFAKKLGVLTESNSIIVDKNQQTNLDGLFAAGDCTGGFKQIATAVGQGAVAGKRIVEYVRGMK